MNRASWVAPPYAPAYSLPPGPPVNSVTIRAVQTSRQQPRSPQVDVMLTIHNNGKLTAQSITVDSIMLRTLAGAGQATLTSPVLPIRLSNLRPGDSTSILLKLNVPLSVTWLSLTQQGTITSGNTRVPEVFRFSAGQALFLP
jgi:hypothetical protein